MGVFGGGTFASRAASNHLVLAILVVCTAGTCPSLPPIPQTTTSPCTLLLHFAFSICRKSTFYEAYYTNPQSIPSPYNSTKPSYEHIHASSRRSLGGGP
ncbi:hypothetical protein M758_4G065000 [Ceratodon purpureus]|nr:hypothetical protein M758_4G065000 [Ceratodon purpureus]